MITKLLLLKQTIFLFKGLAMIFGLMGINELANFIGIGQVQGSAITTSLYTFMCILMIVGVKNLTNKWRNLYTQFVKNDNVVYLKSYKNKKGCN